MAIERSWKIVVPFLLGQRRDRLRRVCDVDARSWEVLDVPDFAEAEIIDPQEKVRRSGAIYSLLSEEVRAAASVGSVPVSLAGDCVSTLGVLGGLQKAGRSPDRILWLDAHGDFHTWETTQTNYIGGMPLAMLVGRGDQGVADAVGLAPYPENRVVLCDARDLDPGEERALRASRIVISSVADVVGHLTPRQSLYLHWDTDVLDAEMEMPALKYHVKGGPTYTEMKSLFRSLRGHNIVAVSVSAWHAELDLDDRSATACLRLLKELGVDVAVE
jgi:arginase